MITSATHSSMSPPAIVLPWAAAIDRLRQVAPAPAHLEVDLVLPAPCDPPGPRGRSRRWARDGRSRACSPCRACRGPTRSAGPSASSTITFTSLRRAASVNAVFELVGHPLVLGVAAVGRSSVTRAMPLLAGLDDLVADRLEVRGGHAGYRILRSAATRPLGPRLRPGLCTHGSVAARVAKGEEVVTGMRSSAHTRPTIGGHGRWGTVGRLPRSARRRRSARLPGAGSQPPVPQRPVPPAGRRRVAARPVHHRRRRQDQHRHPRRP